MTPLSSLQISRFALIWLAMIMTAGTGCTSLTLPDLPPNPFTDTTPDEYEGADGGFELQPSDSETIYHQVRQARAQNAIVLEVEGDPSPARVLPLPPGQTSVYVSDLLKQTGVLKKLHSVETTLFRYSTDTIGGIPMAVKMSKNGQNVRPESDYALQAGDRLHVRKTVSTAIQDIFNAVLGI